MEVREYSISLYQFGACSQPRFWGRTERNGVFFCVIVWLEAVQSLLCSSLDKTQEAKPIIINYLVGIYQLSCCTRVDLYVICCIKYRWGLLEKPVSKMCSVTTRLIQVCIKWCLANVNHRGRPGFKHICFACPRSSLQHVQLKRDQQATEINRTKDKGSTGNNRQKRLPESSC